MVRGPVDEALAALECTLCLHPLPSFSMAAIPGEPDNSIQRLQDALKASESFLAPVLRKGK